jgi:hypothetical protein
MKKLLIVAFVLISSLSFASSGVRVNSGSISLGLGDRNRGSSDVTLVLNVGNERDYHRNVYEHRYVKREVYRYRDNSSGPRYMNPQRVTVVNNYRGNGHKKNVHKYTNRNTNSYRRNKQDTKYRNPQEVVIINKYNHSRTMHKSYNRPTNSK